MAYFTYFDTVSYIYSYAQDNDAAFQENCKTAAAVLERYHQLFDIYHEYTGVTNLATLNRSAGGEALEVDPELVESSIYQISAVKARCNYLIRAIKERSAPAEAALAERKEDAVWT